MSGPTTSDPTPEPRERALTRTELDADPVRQFRRWLDDARTHAGVAYPEAAVLATVGPDGSPQGRIVLVKETADEGFVFYTNFRSEKGRALDRNPRAELVFYWQALWRQVRIRGEAERLPDEKADAYFAGRPRESQLGAWASQQSEPLEDRETLDARFREVEERYRGRPVPRPPHWGGYRVVPGRIELWQGRGGRLHDRFVYVRGDPAEEWRLTRLNP